MTSAHPGMVSNRNPVSKLSLGMTGAGMVSPRTRPPNAAAASDAASCVRASSSSPAMTMRTFQLSGRFAAADMSPISSASASPNWPTPGMNSSVVPSCSPVSAHNAISSSWVAKREGTGAPSPSLWVPASDDEKPMPPSDRLLASSSTIASISSGFASRSHAASPMITRRIAECPTRKPAFTARVPSSRAR